MSLGESRCKRTQFLPVSAAIVDSNPPVIPPAKELLAPWPARTRWQLRDGSLARLYGNRGFLAIRAVPNSDSTMNVELPLGEYLSEIGKDLVMTHCMTLLCCLCKTPCHRLACCAQLMLS